MKLIDVDVLLTQMKECYERRAEESNMTGDRTICVTWHDAVILIKNAPIVDAMPVVHGKWAHLGGDEWCCSACGEIECTEGSWEHPLKDRGWKYCRACGAKMDERKEE